MTVVTRFSQHKPQMPRNRYRFLPRFVEATSKCPDCGSKVVLGELASCNVFLERQSMNSCVECWSSASFCSAYRLVPDSATGR